MFRFLFGDRFDKGRQNLISADEWDRLGMHAEMLASFAITFELSVDELLGLKRTH